MNTKSINDKIALYPILNDVKQALILKNVSDRTVTNYMDGIARFLDFIKYDNLFEITEDHFRNYLFYLHSCNFSTITINTYNSFIRFSLMLFSTLPSILIASLWLNLSLKISISFLTIRFLLFFLFLFMTPD